ncbi:hypothetical protein AB0L57_15290 [Nocardia sp. NPDC052254]|uniref:hypothetical protein n=1 Tax=Nocardia sp. NPDC052254 TaxID=3155681 RepID=UPI00341A9501
MPDSRHEPHDQPIADVGPPVAPHTDPVFDPPPPDATDPPPHAQYPAAHEPLGHLYPQPPSASPAGGSRAGLIAAGVAALVLVLGIGVAVGFSVGGDTGDRGRSAPADTTTTAAASATGTTSALPRPAPGIYSMDAVANACDLVDPAPLTKWSSTPKPVQHNEMRPAEHGIGSLLCQLGYTSTSPVDDVTSDEASMSVQVVFTNAGLAPEYDKWKQDDTTRTQEGSASGGVTDIGTQGYWRSLEGNSSVSTGMNYIVGVQDSNTSVRVEVAVLRAIGEPPVSAGELESIARAQARKVLDGLRKR